MVVVETESFVARTSQISPQVLVCYRTDSAIELA